MITTIVFIILYAALSLILITLTSKLSDCNMGIKIAILGTIWLGFLSVLTVLLEIVYILSKIYVKL